MTSPSIAIIVPVWNEETYLPDLLNSIQQQTVLPDEVIIVDAKSTDQTPSITNSYPFTTYVVSPQLGVSEQRNYGASTSTADLYLFCDADTILPQNCIETIKRRSKSTASFPIYAPKEQDLFVSSLYAIQSIYFSLVQWIRPVMAGPMMVIPRTSFERIGGFDSTKQFEDVYMSDLVGRHTRVRVLPIIVRTSNRRFVSDGYTRTAILYITITLLAFFGLHIPKKYINLRFGHHSKSLKHHK